MILHQMGLSGNLPAQARNANGPNAQHVTTATRRPAVSRPFAATPERLMVQSDIRTVPIPGQLLQHEDVHLGQLGGGLDERGARGEAAVGQAGAHLDARGAGLAATRTPSTDSTLISTRMGSCPSDLCAKVCTQPRSTLPPAPAPGRDPHSNPGRRTKKRRRRDPAPPPLRRAAPA